MATHASWGEILIVGDEQSDSTGRNSGHTKRQSTTYIAELYDPATNTFASPPPRMLEGRIGAAAMLLNKGPNPGKVLVAGGINRERGALTLSELFNPADGEFTVAAHMGADFFLQPSVEIDKGPLAGRFLLGNAYGTLIYDPIGNQFGDGPKMMCSQPLYTATLIPSGPQAGKILFAGGDIDPRRKRESDCPSVNDTELYDPKSNQFQPGPRMNTGRWGHTATLLTSGPHAGQILLVGGYSGYVEPGEQPKKLVPLASTELYDPATNTFSPSSATPAMKTPRADHTATVITLGPNSGKILIAGGQQTGGTTLASTEFYNPSTNSFTVGPDMLSPRTQHIAIGIPSGPEKGKILIAAGVLKEKYDDEEYDWHQCFAVNLCISTALDSTELYDPIANRFIRGPKMHGAPGQAVAVQLPPAPPSR